jgi:hypothetical protein
MKKIILFFSLLLAATAAFAQMQLTKEHLPKAGDIVTVYGAKQKVITIDTGGAGIIWDYRHLERSGASWTTRFE